MPVESGRDRIYSIINRIKEARSVAVKYAGRYLLYSCAFCMLLLIYKFGFSKPEDVNRLIIWVFEIALTLCFFALLFRVILDRRGRLASGKAVSEYFLLLFVSMVLSVRIVFTGWFDEHIPWLNFFQGNFFLYLGLLLVFITELSRHSLKYHTPALSPARLFIYSFAGLIILGTVLLLLPAATKNGISIIDAFFTATSAVCVTGLTVVDTAENFTFLGKLILLLLFQAGGLGVMTFTSFFGYLFQGGFTFKNELFLQDILKEERMGEIFKSLLKILSITLGIEITSAILIYFSLDNEMFGSFGEQVFFSVFHAVSAFCNAGFSTFSLGLYDPSFRFNYAFLLIISFTIIIGGLGFPIIFNYYRYIKHYLWNKWRQVIFGKKYHHSPRIINVNTRIVVYVTLILLLAGTFLFYISEFGNTLAEHNWGGKLAVAFFGSVTPRTAGFNSVNMAVLTPATVLVYILLMWIGASPGSTGGGIKTTTFAIALLSSLSVARGKTRLEIFRREIPEESVRRSLAMIILSIICIGTGIFLITVLDKDKTLMSVIFECFSAFSTVGLSLGITPYLSSAGKLVIILLMFVGRVGALTLIIGFIKKASSQNYRYPRESIFIN